MRSRSKSSGDCTSTAFIANGGGEGFYNTPFDIITNCHPYPYNWNGKPMINRLIKETKMVSAKFDGAYGTYTRDEANVWEMTDVKPLN